MGEQQEAQILRCRAHFDASQSVKENKNNLSADMKAILAEEGIDASKFRIHYTKVLKSKKEPHVFEYVLVGLQISDDGVVEKLRKGRFSPDGPKIAGKKTGEITALWAGKKPAQVQPDKKTNGLPSSTKKIKVKSTAQKESSSKYLMVTAGAAVAAGLCVYLMHHHRHRFTTHSI